MILTIFCVGIALLIAAQVVRRGTEEEEEIDPVPCFPMKGEDMLDFLNPKEDTRALAMEDIRAQLAVALETLSVLAGLLTIAGNRVSNVAERLSELEDGDELGQQVKLTPTHAH